MAQILQLIGLINELQTNATGNSHHRIAGVDRFPRRLRIQLHSTLE
jgi:hypothetical protein